MIYGRCSIIFVSIGHQKDIKVLTGERQNVYETNLSIGRNHFGILNGGGGVFYKKIAYFVPISRTISPIEEIQVSDWSIHNKKNLKLLSNLESYFEGMLLSRRLVKQSFPFRK